MSDPLITIGSDLISKWKEYKDWIHEKNKPVIEFWLSEMNRQRENRDKVQNELDKLRDKTQEEYNEKLKRYNTLPFYKKWFRDKPTYPRALSHSHFIAPPMTMWMPICEKTTIEGFMDWLSKQEEKKT